MVYSDDPRPGKSVATIDVDEADSMRFSLSDEDICELARMGMTIEKHYQRPMDIEWGKDGNDGKLYILQARPETVQSRSGRTIQRFTLKDRSTVLSTGRSIGRKIGVGTAKVISKVTEMSRVQSGDVLLVRTGRWERVRQKGQWNFLEAASGLHTSVATWLRARDVAVIGHLLHQQRRVRGIVGGCMFWRFCSLALTLGPSPVSGKIGGPGLVVIQSLLAR